MISLYDYQELNYARIKEIFTYSRFAFNLSELGSGKSIIGLKIGEDYDNIVVVSYPAVINQNWIGLIQKYGLQKKIQTITINSLRGRKNYKLNNDYLIREDIPLKQPVFKVTPYWKQICTSRTLLIIDEFQMTKNKNIGAKAVKALIGTILESENSNILLMSGTPIDNIDQIMNYLKLLNLIKKSRKFAALKELIKDEEEINCFNFDVKLVDYFKNNFLLKFSDKMSPFARKIVGKLSYLTLGEREKELASSEVQSLTTLCKKLETSGKLDSGDSLSIKQHLQNIELVKMPELAVQIINLMCKKKKKIVIALFYIKPIMMLYKLLEKYKPQLIIGETKNLERTSIISRFQEDNLNCRLIIANADIISTGINLDDTTGLFPRICFLSSNYKSMISHQLFYRFCRVTTKSTPEIKIIFCKDLNEDRVLEILNNKTKILKDFSSSSFYLSDFKQEYL